MSATMDFDQVCFYLTVDEEALRFLMTRSDFPKPHGDKFVDSEIVAWSRTHDIFDLLFEYVPPKKKKARRR